MEAVLTKTVFVKYKLNAIIWDNVLTQKTCRFCKDQTPSSKEHLIANSRLKQISSFKANVDDGRQKKFQGITCESCNNNLGNNYESLSPAHLGYATIWKVLAGNINGVFERMPEYKLLNTKPADLSTMEDRLLQIIKNPERIVPNSTFSFDRDNSFKPEDSHEIAVRSVCLKVTDQAGSPLSGVMVYIKDEGGSDQEIGYSTETDVTGSAHQDLVTRLESVKVVPDSGALHNSKTKETIYKTIDFIIYISQTYNTNRLIVIQPIFAPKTGWEPAHTQWLSGSDLSSLSLIQKHYPELNITSISPYFTKVSDGHPEK